MTSQNITIALNDFQIRLNEIKIQYNDVVLLNQQMYFALTKLVMQVEMSKDFQPDIECVQCESGSSSKIGYYCGFHEAKKFLEKIRSLNSPAK